MQNRLVNGWLTGVAALLVLAGCSASKQPFYNKLRPTTEICHSDSFTGTVAQKTAAPAQIFGDRTLSRYVVKRGDTLWDIAGRFLARPWYWKQVWYNNPQIKNPHWIYPGDVLSIVNVQGERRITISEGNPVYHGAYTGAHTQSGLKIYKYRPQVTSEQIGNEPISIAGENLRPFMRHARVMPVDVPRHLPAVFANSGDYITMTTQQMLYSRELPGISDTFDIYRIGQRILDRSLRRQQQAAVKMSTATPNEARQRTDAYVMNYIGTVKYVGRDKETGLYQLRPETIAHPIKDGDRLAMPEDDVTEAQFFPSMPVPYCLRGVMLANADTNSISVKQYDTVVTSFGADNQAKVGNIWRIVEPGRMKNVGGQAVQLPSRTLGHLMIVKVYPQFSLGFVLDSRQNLDINDWLVRPE